ncbi:MAG TPA: phosphate ABC transporter substrate-binding protein PstS [Thermoplasmata archaeon]|nr:phosphate ABC transporter substrate-binding protein PstS [Thermoplasmata archaeon]
MSGISTEQSTETIKRQRSGHTALYAVGAVVIIVGVAFGGLYATHTWPFGPAGTPAGSCGTQSLLGGGSTFVLPLMTTWYGNYSVNHVNYQGIGSGAGISQITAKHFDFGASDAPLNASQRAAASGILEFPESAGAVAIIYNLPGVTKTVNLSGNVLAEIYLGTITNWSDPRITALNPATTLPATSIVVYERSDSSGTTYAFTDFLSKDNAQWNSQFGKTLLPKWPTGTGEAKSSGVAGSVVSTADSIGYVDLTYALNHPGIGIAAIQNPAGKNIVPSLSDTLTAVQDGMAALSGGLPSGSGDWSNVSLVNAPGSTDYPITTFTYVLVYQDVSTAYAGTALAYSAQKAEALVNWLDWMLTNGQTFSSIDYYTPLPSNVVTADQTTVASMNYGGASIASCT